jgi:anaphase-promoting complex subunit 6
VLERPAEEAPSASGSEGWGLRGNGDLLACRADNLYHRAEYQQCYDLTKR